MLRTKISEDMKTAMRAKEMRKVATLRLVIAALKDQEINQRTVDGAEELTDQNIMQTLTKMVRQRRDSIQMYEEGGRIDLAEQEREEISVIEAYLPQPMTEDEIVAAVNAVVADSGAEGLKDMGKCMGALKQKYVGRMDMSVASKHLKAALS